MFEIPTVSVIMPVFNGGTYLIRAIESILTQSMTDFELLAIDDGSDDGSGDLVRRCAASDGRMRVLGGPRQGLERSLNIGIAEARGRYIARMDADDVSLQDRFQLQVAVLDTHPEIVVVGGQALIIDPDGEPIRPWNVPVTHEGIDDIHLAGRGSAILHPAAMIRTSTARQLGGYRTDFHAAEDLDFWLRIAEVGKLYNVRERVLLYRTHSQSVSFTRGQAQRLSARNAADAARSRRGLPSLPPLPMENTPSNSCCVAPADVELAVRFDWAFEAWKAGFYRTARKHAWHVIRQRSLSARSWKLMFRALMGRYGKPLYESFGRSRTRSGNAS